MSVIIFLIVLGLLIFSHELGHFLIAKLAGIKVLEFGFGFPPRLWGKKMGDTTYSVNWLPFGGFVKLLGEDAIAEISPEEREKNFSNKPKILQAAVLVAGVIFNLLLAWILISGGYIFGLPVSAEAAPRNATLSDTHIIITQILPNSPAQMAGLAAGDTIVFPDMPSTSSLNPSNVQNYISQNKDKEIRVDFRNASGEEKSGGVTPREGVIPGKAGIGIGLDVVGTLRLSFFSALTEGVKTTFILTKATLIGLGRLIYGAFSGTAKLSEVSGPVGIVGMVGSAYALGFVYLILFTAIISINLAIINLIPFPALDGGRLLFLAIEAVKGTPIKPKIAAYANMIGFALLILLMLVVTYNDIAKLVSS